MQSLPLILGHRGASAVAPENTLAAFSRAMRDGADGIEFDVRLSRDRVPVVIHDASLKRTALIDRLVSDLSSEELQKTDVGTWFDQRHGRDDLSGPTDYSVAKLPTLAQVLDLFKSNTGLLYLEMKCDASEAAALATEVVTAIRRAQMIESVVVESFDLPAIVEVKRMDPAIRTAALFEPKFFRPLPTVQRTRMIDLALAHGADELALNHTLAGTRLVERARARGLEVVVWTVDSLRWVERARNMGIKALIANDPAPLVHHRNGSR
jgi:glycerophosphoryl diester phosphodiesterase